ncbi:PREDICTED: uncharacterized protein LOC108663042 [Theobroma cacao]|uniref:Uncharacterized protein LOC108663042 n=1 Tax=Theobroma cacao TaxID=3641 RepID=A0AB32WTI3_THECC|nr:PREDICTED: uncharacterized protein LOC108663042 [Theobroma cacao]
MALKTLFYLPLIKLDMQVEHSEEDDDDEGVEGEDEETKKDAEEDDDNESNDPEYENDENEFAFFTTDCATTDATLVIDTINVHSYVHIDRYSIQSTGNAANSNYHHSTLAKTRVTPTIMRIIKSHFSGPWPTWKLIPTIVKEAMWRKFKKSFTWADTDASMVYNIWEKIYKDQLKDLLADKHEKAKKDTSTRHDLLLTKGRHTLRSQ